jgi:hypothetical protein
MENQKWLEEILSKSNVAEIIRWEVAREIDQAVLKAVLNERERVTKELGDWKKHWLQLKDLLKRFDIDRKTRKAWMVMGDYQLTQEFIRAVEKKSGWKLPDASGQ